MPLTDGAAAESIVEVLEKLIVIDPELFLKKYKEHNFKGKIGVGYIPSYMIDEWGKKAEMTSEQIASIEKISSPELEDVKKEVLETLRNARESYLAKERTGFVT
jgi:hypothetical protein